jgi:hypothetical protein
MNCDICGNKLRGGIEALEGAPSGGKPLVRLFADPDRNWIECSGCSRIVCSDCCDHPGTGFCDNCLAQSDLFEELQFVENCSLDELEKFMEGKRNGMGDEPSATCEG